MTVIKTHDEPHHLSMPSNKGHFCEIKEYGVPQSSTASARRASTAGKPSGGLGVSEATAEGARERERRTEEAAGGRYARLRGAEGPIGTKAMPAAKGAHLHSAFDISEQ